MASAAEKLRRLLEMVPGLQGRGPGFLGHGRWVDGTHQLLITLFGQESPQAAGFLEIVGEGAEARGWGLPLAPEHPWGMQARLQRAEEFLAEVLAQLEARVGTDHT